jgi:hypothetical protein
MKTEYTFFIEMAIFIIYGVIITFYSLRGLITERPAIIHNLIYFGPLFLLFVVMYANILFIGPFDITHIRSLDIMSISFPVIAIAMLIIMTYFIGKQIFGYFVIGVGDEFGDAIVHALNENKIQHQEKLSRIILPEYNTQISIAITKWIGSAQIRIDSGKHQTVLNNLITSVESYYSKEKCNRNTLLMFTIFGIIIIIAGIILLISMLKLFL